MKTYDFFFRITKIHGMEKWWSPEILFATKARGYWAQFHSGLYLDKSNKCRHDIRQNISSKVSDKTVGDGESY